VSGAEGDVRPAQLAHFKGGEAVPGARRSANTGSSAREIVAAPLPGGTLTTIEAADWRLETGR
jgi:hypothetical protein